MAEEIAGVVASQPRDHWAEVFDGTDACVSPVLDMGEAKDHPHNVSRGTFFGDPVQPAPGPRFSRTPGEPGGVEDLSLDDALARWG